MFFFTSFKNLNDFLFVSLLSRRMIYVNLYHVVEYRHNVILIWLISTITDYLVWTLYVSVRDFVVDDVQIIAYADHFKDYLLIFLKGTLKQWFKIF